ncbi:unnamed protein product [Rodentolepis nana]|uniref:Reverse transcriptase domain-containing protein n=1 Tax=Rodentolepis nana TaxID=102285 RepID=A0A0R3T2H3_RODNA|nr:unnamed protein product [Rodentolepis nana]
MAKYFARFYSYKPKKNPFVIKSSRSIKIQARQFGEIKEDTTIPNNILTEPFRNCELNAAIKQLKCKKSPGEDGLPHGAVTSCTLFNVFINDIAELVQTVAGIKCLLYADDLVLWYSAPKKNAQERTESALNCALKQLANWCDNNGMVINTAKTAFQTFSLAHHSINPLLRYKDTTLEKTNEFTYLGMAFNTKLTWKSRIAKIAERISNRLNVLKRLASSVWDCARSTLNTTCKIHRGDSQTTREGTQPSITTNHWRDNINTQPLDYLRKSNTPPEQMPSLALETINVIYPADQWPQVFTDGPYIQNQANVGAGVYSELFSFYAASGHKRSAFEGERGH